MTAVTARVPTSTTWMSWRVVSRSASRRRFEVKAIRVPSGDQAGSRSETGPSVSAARLAGRDVDQPEVLDPVVDEPGPVEHVVEPVDEPVVGRRRRPAARARDRARAGARPPGRVAPTRRADDDEPRPVGRPLERLDAARQVGQAPRLAAVERQQVDLLAVLAVAPSIGAAIGLLLDDRTAVRDERERPAVRREARMPVVADAERQLASRGRPVGRDEPQGAAIAIEPGRDRLER